MTIDRPIFMLGPGRSGSTLLHTLITHHPQCAYLLSWSSKYPRLSWLSLGARLRSPELERKGKTFRFYPRPTESYSFWTHCFPNFWEINRAPCMENEGKHKLQKLIKTYLKLQGRNRFLAKVTGKAQFQFLSSIFHDARFVWIDRDPRAVAYSFFRKGWIGIPKEQISALPRLEQLAHAAKRYLEIFHHYQKEETPHFFLKYEAFTHNPRGEMSRLLDYLELPQDHRLLDLVEAWPISTKANDQWRKGTTQEERKHLESLLAAPLTERDYALEFTVKPAAG